MEPFAAAHVDHVRIRRRHRHRADGAGGLVVEDGIPGAAVVVRLPDAAVVDADVEDVGLIGTPAQPTVRPPRNGPIMRHSRPE